MSEIFLPSRMQNKINWGKLAGLGFIFGALSLFSPGSLFVIFLSIFIILTIRANTTEGEKTFLTRLFIYGITLRVFLALLIQFILVLKGRFYLSDLSDNAVVLFGDDGMNTMLAWYFTRLLTGMPLGQASFSSASTLTSFGDYGLSGYTYFLSIFYRMFGYSPLSVTFINCIVSVLTGIIYYAIAKKIAGIKTAKITAILVTFFPSLVVWSSVNLKEPLFMFLTGVVLWAFLKWLEKPKILYLVLILLATALQYTLRMWVFWPTLLILGLCYLITKVKIKIVHILVCIVIFFSLGMIFKVKFDTLKGKLINYHLGVFFTGGSTYRIYDDWLYQHNMPTEAVPYMQMAKGFLRGWLHFLLEPFPWRVNLKSVLAVFPQMLIWYLLLPLSCIGMLVQLRYNRKKAFVLVLYFFIMGSIIALTAGNIGTNFRMRDMLTPIVLLFAAVGLVRIFNFKQKREPINQNP